MTEAIEQVGLLRAIMAGIRAFQGISPGFMNTVDYGRLAKRIQGEVRAYIQGRGGVQESESASRIKELETSNEQTFRDLRAKVEGLEKLYATDRIASSHAREIERIFDELSALLPADGGEKA